MQAPQPLHELCLEEMCSFRDALLYPGTYLTLLIEYQIEMTPAAILMTLRLLVLLCSISRTIIESGCLQHVYRPVLVAAAKFS